ncbi:MAG TPA: Hpt domain-containing protein [Usitatibacter sp.]|jgi:chemosensory pili system protein ChpA (sensor histidine kinase/response regulator)|nr:Hpt domain-containing protein [Usitatibacter sp.]
MAANVENDFDLGPLTWVKTEIDHSLNQARETLDKLTAAPAERAPVKYILTHLHQATGALSMVGLGAATRFNEELEKLVALLEGEDAARLPEMALSAKRAISALSRYLDALISGQADQPMRLLAPYLELNHATGRNDGQEGDLFYPDLATALPPLPSAAPLDDAVLAKALAHQRSQYQQGLLRMLKGGDISEALRQMHAALGAIESLPPAGANRGFWAAAAAFFDALVLGGAEVTPRVKPLFAKLDQQIKQLIDGVAKVPERLFRDLLLAVGHARPVSERIQVLKAAYRLEALLAVPEGARSAGDEQLASLVRELRELTNQQKDTWLKYTSGNRAAIEPFGKQAIVLAERAARLGNAEVQRVLARLAEVAPPLKAKAIPPSEAQSLEVATALLFIESALENYSKLGADFAKQAQTVAARLQGALAGEALAPVDAAHGGLLDAMTRRAQEKLLVFQVGQEVQVNLQGIESVLDGFFRDASRRADLAGLAPQFAQVQGALMIMELNDAAALNAAVMARVQQFADGSLDGAGENAELVAEGLSALGLYVTALQQGSSSAADALVPALRRFGLVAPEEPGASEVRRTGTVSPIDLEVQKQKVQALYEDWKGAPQADTREKLEKAVGALGRDAKVIGDSAIARESEEALQRIQSGDAPEQTGVFRALQELAPENAPEMPAAQVVQLVDAPGAEIDKELLEIFLEEAGEVIGSVAESLETCRGAADDRDAMTTIRRGFHTLKGSGRMVGLMELGEMAWQCEQVMNKWLKEEKPATPALMDFIGIARGAFETWVAQLQDGRAVDVDAAAIARHAEALKSGAEIAPQPSTAALVADVAASLDFAALTEVQPAAPQPEEAQALASSAEAAGHEPALELVTPPQDAAVPAGEAPGDSAQPDAGASAREAQPAYEPATPSAAFDFGSLDLSMPQADAPAPPATSPDAEPSLSFDDLVAPARPVEAQADEEAIDEIVIGHVALPRALFIIYVGEAEQHVATLDAEMSRLAADPMLPVSAEFMRAAHTLCSSSRTTGFEALADLAYGLEKWLQDAMELPPEFDARRLAVTRRSVDGLTAMVESIRGNALPYPRDELVAELAALREELREARRTGEGTHVRMPQVVRDALEARAVEAEAVELPPAGFEPASAGEQNVQPLAPPAPVEPLEALMPAEPIAPAARIETPAPVEPPVALEPPTPTVQPAAPVAPAATQPVPVAFEGGKDQRRIKDDVDHDLLPVFLEEARDLIPQVSDAVRQWKASPTDHAPAGALQRHLHTLKGSARMTGLMRLGELAHVLETRVIAMEAVASPPVREFEELEDRVDRFSLSLERLAKGEDILEAEPIDVPVAAVFEHQKDKPAALAVIAAAAQERADRDALTPEARESRGALLRVNADMIDRFVNEAGELSIARSRIELEVATFRRSMQDLTENIGRMRAQLREVEIAAESQMQSTIKARGELGETFDPLEFDRFTRMQELTRFLAESLGDVITLHQGLQKNLDEAELAIHAQARLNRELQQGLMGVRLVPLVNLADRFYRIVRQTAKELEKKANLELKGTRVELDRSVLEKITGPFEHLLRNAIAHGIETPAQRLAAGKPDIGEITLDAAQRGNEVVLTIADDGAGLDYRRIREKAIESGLLAPDVELPEAQLAQFIFLQGFSTAKEVSQVAGRGVGMDVVRAEITALGGRVEIASTRGRGTVFTITLPLTLAVTQAVMVRAGETIYAVPSVMIEQVVEYKGPAYEEMRTRGEVAWKDWHYPLRSLLPLLGALDSVTPARQIPVLLLKSGTQRAAIRVDEIIGNREVVVKTIGPQLSRLAGIAGATVLGNGQVVLILNPVQLVYRDRSGASTEAAPAMPLAAPPAPVPAQPAPEARATPLVMVVDDSLTVRKITSRMLAREGYEVATAKDGVDALQQLQDLRPDCILLDVEMPRMDGFEFARNLRADETTSRIPIIMITSRTADKHRNHALELGVNEYMGKPYQEEQLLALIKRYTRELAAA